MIAVTSKSFSKNKELISELKKVFPDEELQLQFGTKGLNQEELIQFLQGCERAIIALEEINKDVLMACPDLKRISKFGVGLNNINLEDCKTCGVEVGWTGGVNRLSVAEMTLGFMLGLSRNLFQASFDMKEGNWNKNGGFQLSGKTIGIIGIGHIGKEVIRLLKPFGCQILVNDIIDQDDYYKKVDVTLVSKDEIYEHADIITIHTPHTSETQNLFNRESFGKCKKTPYIINTARGGIVNQNDLIWALNESLVSGAALDVYEVEPLDQEEIYKNKKIITTPHIGGNAKEAVHMMGLSAIENLKGSNINV